MSLDPAGALLAASSLHLGFQALVTVVVYPALIDVPADRFAAAHAAHSRRMGVVVALVYGLLAAACLNLLVAGPRSVAAVAVVGAVGALLATG